MSELADFDAVDIIRQLKDNHISGRDLPRPIRREIVAILDQTLSQAEVAHILGIGNRTIQRDVKFIKNRAAKLVKNLTVEKVGGELIRKATIIYKFAIKAKDYKLAWQVETDLIDKLQSLGFVIQAPGTGKGVSVSIGNKETNILQLGNLTKDMEPGELKALDELCRKVVERTNKHELRAVESRLPQN